VAHGSSYAVKEVIRSMAIASVGIETKLIITTGKRESLVFAAVKAAAVNS